jgi:acyl-CoA synthetase (AMP-forming)/AMP-acid ligase II
MHGIAHAPARAPRRFAPSSSLVHHIERADPRLLAVDDGDKRLSYGELTEAARLVAGGIAARHGRDGYLVVRAEVSTSFVTALLGVMYSGNTPIPVDPGLPAPALEHILQKSGASAVIDPADLRPLTAAGPLSDVRMSRPALVLFTSGTTGLPKGVLISHENLWHSCSTIAGYLDYRSHPSAAVVLPLHYSYALLSQVCCHLMIGGRIRLFRDLRNPLRFAAQVADERLQTFCGVPSTYHALATFHALRPLRFESVRILCSAGAPMDRSRLDVVKAMFPRAAFFNNYGMTEAAPRIAFIRDDDPRFAEPTCGRPMAGVEVKVVDPETHAALPDGESGVLVVRGPNVTSGYLNDPERTREAFTRDGFLISGDMAYLDRGYIFIRGRYDDVFNCGGEKVAPAEIERVLNRIDGVELSAVVGVADEARGMVPVAFLRTSQPLTRAAIVSMAAALLPKSKVPVRYFEVTGFPMTPNGKLQRKLLSADDAERIVREIT